MATLRSYAYAARFTAQSRVLLLARDFEPGVAQILASDPWILWIAQGVRDWDASSWRVALDAVAAMPSASVDRIVWFADRACEDPEDTQRWLVECSRVLDRNGTLMIRLPRLKESEGQDASRDPFWRLVDSLHAEFPWVDLAAEVSWQASSVTPVEEPKEGFPALEVDSRLADDADTQCEAYWCMCALRKEDSQGWKGPTLMLRPQQQGQGDDAQQFWAQRERVEQQCKDAAKLFTAQRRIEALNQRLDVLAQETQAWQEDERPELLCKMVELQDRSMWLREQVVHLEQLSVKNVEARTRLEWELAQANAHQKTQSATILELKAKVKALQALQEGKATRTPSRLLHTESDEEQEPVTQNFSDAANSSLPKMASSEEAPPEPVKQPPPEPATSTRTAAATSSVGSSGVIEALAMRLASVAPDDQRVLTLKAAEPEPSRSVEAWIERVRSMRSKLGAQAPEFVTRPLSASEPKEEP